jgi:colicin import membrane protein
MKAQLILTATIATLLSACSSEPKPTMEARTEAAREEADKAAREAREEARRAKEALSRRLDQLDEEIDRLEAKAKKASAKTKAKLNEEARDMRVEAKKLRARMSTWDDKAESAWKTAKREIEEGLDKTESTFKKIWADIKD